MSITFDFQVLSRTEVPGISLVYAQNETAYNYLVEEAEMATLRDGAAPLATDKVGDFISDAGWAHLSTQLV